MSPSPERSILYVHKGASSFVRRDRDHLATAFIVHDLAFTPKAKWQLPFLLVYQLVVCIRRVPGVSAVVCQFAGYHALVPVLMARLMGRPTMVLSNGSDCVSFPSLGYGHFRKPLLAAATRWTFRSCDLIVPLDASLAYSEPTYHDLDGPVQGIRHFVPHLRTPIEPLGYGFDAAFWKAPPVKRDERRFITVASGAHEPRIQVIKGLDLIMQVAPRFPDHEFVVVGARAGSLPHKPRNVIEVPHVPHEELPRYYASAAYYLQLSVTEGFGNALCEAMLCGCVPIVSAVGAMPGIVGDAGFVLGRRDVDALQRLLEEVSAIDVAERSRLARERIVADRPVDLRREGLVERLAMIMRPRR